MNILFFILLGQIAYADLDYTKANKNRKVYDQVPNDELIWSKLQAFEPMYMFEGRLKGRGLNEPLENIFIKDIRDSGITVYVDYFTVAKYRFYLANKGYETCISKARPFSVYKKLNKELKDKNFLSVNNKFGMNSFPIYIMSPIGQFAILTSKLSAIEKHKYPGTNIYNVKSILDDQDLYTVQMQGMASSEIGRYIYMDTEKNITLKPEYKRRVYEFVASNQVQFAMMLRGKRMHWVDMSMFSNFHLLQLGIKQETITMLEYSHVHPDKLKLDDYRLSFVLCNGYDLSKLKKIVSIINKNIKMYRGDIDFYSTILKNYSKDFKVPYQPPDKYFLYKESIKNREKLLNGFFD